jgi:hypothetical protein
MSSKIFAVDAGGTSRLIKTPWAIDAGGTARRAKKIWIVDAGGTSRLVFVGQVTVTIVPGLANASGFAPVTLTTNNVAAQVTGGSGVYTYAWTYSPVSGVTGVIINAPTSPITSFTIRLQQGQDAFGTATCTVTDNAGTVGSGGCQVSIAATN